MSLAKICLLPCMHPAIIGLYFLNNSSSSKIKEIRGKGLILGIEIEGSSSEVQKKAAEKGLLVLTAGPNVIRLLPPLIISEDELSDGINTLISCL